MNRWVERNYDDIMDLPHHVSSRHPQMPLSDRAAQFSPFAALTGHEEAIHEAGRLTEDFIEPGEDRKEQINEQFRILKENQARRPEVEVTYFRPDERKDGGAYVTVRGQVKRIDAYRHQILLVDGAVLSMERIYAIDGEIFENP